MVSTTPYMIRAIYEWCADEALTPHLLVDAEREGVVVPAQVVEDGTVILNIDDSAVQGLQLGNEWILFSARFGGKASNISIPVEAVRAVYAAENGIGCAFPEEAVAIDALEDDKSTPAESSPRRQSTRGKNSKAKPSKRPSLKLVE